MYCPVKTHWVAMLHHTPVQDFVTELLIGII